MDLAINTSHQRGNNRRLPKCWVVGSGSRIKLMPGKKVSRVIRKIIQNNIHKDGVNWKGVPEPHREEYFQTFKNCFRWDLTIEGAVKTAFMKKAAVRYRDMMTTFKKASKKPNGVSEETWEKWLAYWSLPEVMEKSEKASQNRLSEKAGPGTGCSRHSGGSRSALEHAIALEKEIGHAPNAYECFLRLHKRNGTFVDERAKLIDAEVRRRARVARRAGGAAAVDMTQIYIDVVGVYKQCMYGSGSYVDAYVDLCPIARPARVNEASVRRRVTRELQHRFTQEMAEREARLQQQLDGHRREMEVRFQEMRTQLMAEMNRRGPLLPPGQDA